MKRHMDKKSIYEVPEAEVIPVRNERSFLESNPSIHSVSLINYDEEEA